MYIAHKYEGGIFEFLAKYEKEITVVVSSFGFVGTVAKGFRLKEEEKQKETIADNKAKAANNAASSGMESETTEGESNA